MRLSCLWHVTRMFARMAGRVPAGHLWYLLRQMAHEKPHRFDGQTRINTFFPPYPSQAFDRFCDAVIHRRRVPYSTYLAVTGACPFSCGHCSYAGRPAGAMPLAQAIDVIRQIKALGTCTLGLTGGEPMLHDDLEEMIAAATPEMATVLFTTGHRLDGPRARRLKQAGVTCVTIGIESADADEHDRVRGRAGSFAEAETAARACREAGIYLAISTVATRERIASGALDAMYDLGRQWAAGEFRILSPVATGAIAGCAAAMLTDKERQTLIVFHKDHNRLRTGPAVACFARLESPDLFGCGAGFHHLFIDAAGNVCPCDLTPLSFGNLADRPLADIWREMGERFPLPRRTCLMAEIAPSLPARCDTLPLPPDASLALCPARRLAEPLPEGYRRLFAGG